MAEEKAEAPAGEQPAAAPSGSSKKELILPLISTVITLAALGMMIFTKLIFKRPPITEKSERQKIAEKQNQPPTVTAPALIAFDSLTVNIQSVPAQPRPEPGTSRQIKGKLHYVTLQMNVEIKDEAKRAIIDEYRPVLIDEVIALLGKKDFSELTTVQGRYVLRSQIIEAFNKIIEDPLVTNIYFSQFIAQ